MLAVMVESLVSRRKKVNEIIQGGYSKTEPEQVVSDETLFRQLGKGLKVIKHGD